MNDKVYVRFFMAWLTLIDLIFSAVFLLVISSSSDDDRKRISTMNDVIVVNSDGNTNEQAEQEKLVSGNPQITIKEDYEGTMDESYVEFLNVLLIGNYYVSDAMWFDFEPDGVFNGFFDNDSTNMSNGFYEVVMIGEVPTLHIYNEDRTEMVSYTLMLNQQDVILRYEPANISLELKN